jgi:tetratricopeptide (TPR) repeat protein
MVAWRFELLGGLRAVATGRVVDHFPTKRTAALLAFLALHPDTQHSREFLAEMLWPEADFASQRHSLRLALSRLRSLLGPDHPIESTRSHVLLKGEQTSTDVQEFEAAVEAGDRRMAEGLLKRGLLPGQYDDWIVATQARLELLLDGLGDEGEVPLTSLPSAVGRIIGRQADLDQVEWLFSQSPIVVLTGIGGIGKTRLAIEFARQQDRAFWVSLIDLTSADQLPDAVRAAIRSPVPSTQVSLLPYVCRELGALTPALLVLDNAEHLVSSELAETVETLAAVPGVSVLVTSRRPLPITRQSEHPLKPVSTKAGAAIFKERVTAIRNTVQVPDDVLARIAEQHGGVPLAIELGAARVGVQSVREIEQRDVPPFDRLGLPERQQSLAEVVEASLCVFRGGFDSDAAAAVAKADLAALERLRRFGLIAPQDLSNGSVRFRVPEPLRELLADANQETRRDHALYFADWVERNRADHLPEPPFRFGSRLEDQEIERFNVEAALDFCAQSDDAKVLEAGLRIVAAFWTHWYTSNKPGEMERWATSLLSNASAASDPMVLAAGRLSLGLAVRERGDHRAFAGHVSTALETLQGVDAHRDAAFAWHLRGLSLSDLGEHAGADAAYARAEEVWRRIGDTRNYSVTRHNRAMVALDVGDLSTAEDFIWEALETFNAHQSTYLGVAYSTLARLFLARNDTKGAVDALRSAVHWNKQLGYVRGWAQNARDLALALNDLGEEQEARALAHEALGDFRRVGDRHGEATALCAVSKITGERRFRDEARALVARHGIDVHHELLQGLASD